MWFGFKCKSIDQKTTNKVHSNYILGNEILDEQRFEVTLICITNNLFEGSVNMSLLLIIIIVDHDHFPGLYVVSVGKESHKLWTEDTQIITPYIPKH